MGIFGPILLMLLGLWMGRDGRSPWYIKVILAALLVLLVLILLGFI